MRRIWSLLTQYDLQLVELFSALCGVITALWLSLSASETASIAWMFQFLPRSAWVLLLATGGALQLLAVMRGIYWERRATAFCAALTWGFLVVGVALNRGTLAPVAFTLCVTMSWAFLRLSWTRAA